MPQVLLGSRCTRAGWEMQHTNQHPQGPRHKARLTLVSKRGQILLREAARRLATLLTHGSRLHGRRPCACRGAADHGFGRRLPPAVVAVVLVAPL